MQQAKKDLAKAFKYKTEEELKEYVGSKIDFVRKSNGLGQVKFTQPVLVQKLEDEFDFPDGVPPKTSVVAGQVLVKGDGSGVLEGAEATKFRSGTAICMLMH